MKKTQAALAAVVTSIALTGCADTPENRQFWQQLGAGMARTTCY